MVSEMVNGSSMPGGGVVGSQGRPSGRVPIVVEGREGSAAGAAARLGKGSTHFLAIPEPALLMSGSRAEAMGLCDMDVEWNGDR